MSFGGGFGQRNGGGNSETMMVESRDVGKIIGRGGQRIRDLEEQTHARVKVSREEDSNGMKSVEITGSEHEIADAKRMIDDFLTAGPGDFGGARGGGGGGFGGRRDDGWGRRDNYGGGRDGGFGGGFREQSGGEQETIYIESGDVGRIIGKGGSRIRELEQDSGCRIKVSRGGDDSGRSSVELTGSSRSISDAKRLIQDVGVEICNGGGGGGNDRGRW